MKKRLLMLLIGSFTCCAFLQRLEAQSIALNRVKQARTFENSSGMKQIPLKNILLQIENKFNVSIAYKTGLINNMSSAFDVTSFTSVENALQKVLSPFDLSYEKVRDKFYLISKKKMKDEKVVMQYIQNDADRQVHGRVTDDLGNGLTGATVKLKGTNVATETDADGSFTIMVPEGNDGSLEVSFVGYQSLDVPILNRADVSIVLKKVVSKLDEIVVTGYGVQKKKDLTGAVSVVNMGDLISQPSGEVTSQLQGQASGVTVLGSGQPGSEPMIQIRGVNTFGNNTPLYVVDGVPTQSITDLNSNDIASMQILKDAGAASIYGSRASNGVIIITTKKGNGKVKVQYNAYYGRQYPKSGNVWNILNPQEMAQLKFIAFANSGTPISDASPDALYGKGPEPILPDYIQPAGVMEGDPSTDPSLYNVDPNFTTDDEYNNFYRIVKANKLGTDWYHAIFKDAPISNQGLSVSGGGDKGNYLFSFNYFNQQGTLINTYLKRYTIRSNSQYNLNKNIRVGENLSYTISDNPGVGVLSPDAPIGMAIREQPIIPVHDINGNFAGGYGPGLGDALNPVAMQERTKNDKGLDFRLFGNMFVDVDFLKNFTAHTSFGGDVPSGWYHSFSYPQYENVENSTANSYSAGAYSSFDWTWTNTLTFHKIFAEAHDVKILVGSESHMEKGNSVGGTTIDYFSFDPNYVNLSTGSGVQTNNSSRYQNSLFSLFGRIDYMFKDKYLLGATLRRDGSSVFLNNRFGWFPAVSAAWRLSQENFMKNVSWITDLKIRGSWGIMGNQFNVGANNAFTLYNSNRSTSFYDINGTNNSTVMGFQPSQIGNPNAKWESDVNANIGLDATLFNGHIDISADYYRKDIKDLLYNPELPGVAGVAAQPFVNVANMKNEGIDLSISGNTNITHDLRLIAALTFTTYKNRIKKIADDVDYFDMDSRRFGGTIIRNAVGQPVSSFFGYKIIGFWNSAAEIAAADATAQKATGDGDAEYQTDEGVGRFRYADVDGDGQITADDRTFLGNPNPKYSYGINIGLVYKNFDFSIFLYGVQGNQIWNDVRWWTDFYSSFEGAKSKTALYDSWTPDHTNAKAPIQENIGTFSTQGVPNSYFVENGAYLRAKNMQLGYTFHKSLLNKVGVDKFRVYIQAANLFTITKYSGIDPEIGAGDGGDIPGVTDFGIDDGAYPNQRQFLIGLNLAF